MDAGTDRIVEVMETDRGPVPAAIVFQAGPNYMVYSRIALPLLRSNGYQPCGHVECIMQHSVIPPLAVSLN